MATCGNILLTLFGATEVTNKERNRVGSIDALRGVAALGVAWFHVYTQNGGALVSDVAPHAVNLVSVWGRWGVELFFVISGFVVAYTMFDRSDLLGSSGVVRYFLRRSVRLDPTYWFAMCVAITLTPFLIWVSRDDIGELFPPFALNLEHILKNVLYFLPLDGAFYLPVAWTLAIEVHFYILFSLILVLINHAYYSYMINRDMSAALIVLILLSSWALARIGILPARDYWLLWHLEGFIIGMLAATAYKGAKYARLLLGLSFVTICIVYVMRRESDILATLLSGVLVVAVVFSKTLGRLVERRSLLVLGELSYCIYLLHQTVGGLAVELMQTYVSREPGVHQLSFVIVGIGVTVLCASVVHRFVENPSIDLSRRIGALSRRIGATSAVEPRSGTRRSLS